MKPICTGSTWYHLDEEGGGETKSMKRHFPVSKLEMFAT